MDTFLIHNNDFLHSGPISSYFHEKYIPEMSKKLKYSGYIHVLKNTYNERSQDQLNDAAKKLFTVLHNDVQKIINLEGLNNNVRVIGIPRAQIENSYAQSQLLFRDTIEKVSNQLEIVCVNSSLIRIKDTRYWWDKWERYYLNWRCIYKERQYCWRCNSSFKRFWCK